MTESETKIVLEKGITIGGKPLQDHLEAIARAEAYDFLCTFAHKKRVEEKDLQFLHYLFY